MTSPTQTARGAKDLLQHYAEVRARLGFAVLHRKLSPRPVPVLMPVQNLPPSVTAPAELEPVYIINPRQAPLNMLALPSWRFLVALAALRHGVGSDEILSPRRAPHLVAARREAIGLIFQHTPASLPRIGLMLGRDHTTVLHHLRKSGKTLKLVDVPAINKGGRPPKQELTPGRSKAKLDWRAGQ